MTPLTRHIIVEGPDGGGKSRLVKEIMAQLGLPLHERASTSLGGPVTDLEEWSVRDQLTRQAVSPHVYDRHPIISEPIYGRIVRGRPIEPFDNREWTSAYRLKMYASVYVVWCLPGLETVRAHVSPARDMPGVAQNIEKIYQSYERMSRMWGGLGDVYNFVHTTADEMIDRLTFRIGASNG